MVGRLRVLTACQRIQLGQQYGHGHTSRLLNGRAHVFRHADLLPWVASPCAFHSEQHIGAFLPEWQDHPTVTAATLSAENAMEWHNMAIGCQVSDKMARLEGQHPPVNCVTVPFACRNRTSKEIS